MSADKSKPGRKTAASATALLERRQKTTVLYLQGKSQHEIALTFGVTQATISNDLEYIRSQWLASALVDFNEKKAIEIAKIDLLESTAWNAWYRSCEAAEIRHTKNERKRIKTSSAKLDKHGNKKGPDTYEMVDVGEVDETVLKGQTGDERFLARVAWCVETRLKLLGLLQKKDASNVNVVNINWDSLFGHTSPTNTPSPLPPPSPQQPTPVPALEDDICPIETKLNSITTTLKEASPFTTSTTTTPTTLDTNSQPAT